MTGREMVARDTDVKHGIKRDISREDKALKLYEQGVDGYSLAERFSVKPQQIYIMLKNARQRRQEAQQ